MTLLQYREWNPRGDSPARVEQINTVLAEYRAMGYTMTLRQLYYQLVARGFIANSLKSYKGLSALTTKAREAGLVSWTAIEDTARVFKNEYFEEDLMEPIRRLPALISFDQWERQDHYIEVWVEKEALSNVISRACRPLQLPFMATKGYLSASMAWRAGRRLLEKVEEGKHCIIIHLGDHDPSGIDMTRDNQARLDLFSEQVGVEVHRIALNMDQIDRYNPPPFYAKLSDSRAPHYIAAYGRDSWELDALEPQVIERLITEEVEQYIDRDMWQSVETLEREAKAVLGNIYDRWDDIEPIVYEDINNA